MTTVLAEPEVKKRREGGGGAGDGGGHGGGGSRGRGGDSSLPFETARIGLWLLLATITMLFAAFTSSLLVRRAATDWVPLATPSLLWLNTGILLASSVTVEKARRAFCRGAFGFRLWFGVTLLLGALFILGQIAAWRDLAAQGIFLATNPASSFFYVLTGAHAVHVVGGLLALAYVSARGTGAMVAPRLAATYWHFVDGLWLYVFIVLFVI